MKIVYKNDEVIIIKIKENLVYYGNGDNINAFGESAAQFLRFNPYLTDVSNEKNEIPDDIRKIIEKYLNNEK